ncbi:MAG: prolipoprotein diacylglyceryl transferase [Spirochaetia bacterium]|nr:prolipoprotein diacylglyceryl transferase [Spirochaetia bacterium]
MLKRILVFFPVLFLLFLNLTCHYERGFIVIDFLPQSLFFSKISSYGIMLALGFITANFLLQREFDRLKMDTKVADNLIIILAVGGIIGSKIFFVWESYSEWNGWEGFKNAMFSGGGLTWYGGFIVANIMAYIYLRNKKISYLRVADIGAHVMAMGYVFGRMGCLVSGDGCYGIAAPANWPAPFAMAFPNGAAPWSEIIRMYNDPAVRVFNTPLFEALFSFLLFSIFYLLRKKEWPLGVKFMTFILFHSIFRFLVEFIRLNPRDVFGVSQAQFLSIILVVAAVFYYIYKQGEIRQFLKLGKNGNTSSK